MLQLVFEAAFQLVWASLGSVVGPARRAVAGRPAWGDVRPLSAAAAVGVMAIALLMAAPAWQFVRLAVAFLEDDFLFFLGLVLFLPLAVFACVGALAALAGSVRTAVALLAGETAGRAWAWVFSVLGALQVSMYVWLEWHALAALTLAVTVGEVVVLVLDRRRSAAAEVTTIEL